MLSCIAAQSERLRVVSSDLEAGPALVERDQQLPQDFAGRGRGNAGGVQRGGQLVEHFPDTDPEYAGADSLMLARHVARIVRENGWRVENIDSTILCQKPKLAPYIPAMREKLAEAFGMPLDAVSVKATTEEHLGFTGEGLGIAVHAVALIETL